MLSNHPFVVGVYFEQNLFQKLAIFILEQDKPGSLDDAQRVLKEYNISSPSAISEVHFRHANILIRAGRVSRIFHSCSYVLSGIFCLTKYMHPAYMQ